MAELTFTDLLELLGHVEFTAVCHRPPGGVFSSRVVPSFTAYQLIGNLAGDIWFGVNPVFGPARINSGRGLAADVVRLTAVYADLDVKPGGMSSMEAAGQVIEDLSNMLGTRPSAVVLTGHGVQPYWPIEEGPSGPSARALLRRWGRLVAHVAEIHGGRVDPVYDLARVLRVPGTVNHKAEPVPVLGIADRGKPLSVDDVDEALTAYNFPEKPHDRDEAGQAVVSAPAEWRWANQTCNYMTGMMDGWRSDNPTARHPWLVAQATRIASGHRYGCFDEAGYHGTVGVLVGRFRDLLARGPEARKETPGEIADALGWGQALASGKSDAEIERELGGHSHEVLSDLTFERRDPFDNSSSESASQENGADTETHEEFVRRKFPVLDWEALWSEEIGEDWILEPLIAARRGIALFSAPKIGKSLLALEIAVGISNGTRTLGAMPDRAHRVLYVDHENDPHGDIRVRLEDMEYGPDDLQNLYYLSYPAMAPLDTSTGALELVDTAVTYGCDIVIVDTISRAVVGEENDNNTWLALYRLTGVALKKAGIAMVRLDHTGKDLDKGMRGGSAKYGDLDAIWKMTKEAEMTYKLTLTDSRFRITEEELVLTRSMDPLSHKVEGRGWMVAADRKFNELLDHLLRLDVPPAAGRSAARAALKLAGIKATNSDLENALRHRKTCSNVVRAGHDHKTCARETELPGLELTP